MLLEGTGKRGNEKSSADQFRVPAAITDTGCERELNEDRYAVIESPSGLAWIVCDGMGGATGGELAAQLAIDAIRRDLENLPQRTPAQAIKSAILEANRIIVLRRQNPAFSGMGTTVIAAMFQGNEIAIAHAGDSRAYLVRDGAIQQLTTDHTYVQDLVDRGKLDMEAALSHPQAHVLTRCIGSEPGLEVDIERFWLWESGPNEVNDFMLLCSDGLYSLVSEGEMANILSQHPPQHACVHLVELAKSRGGYDNITVAVIPLGGQLRNEPPRGFEASQRKRKRTSSTQSLGGTKGILTKLLIILVLCGLSGVLTVLLSMLLI